MAEVVVTETTAEAPDPDPEQEEQNCLLSVWNFRRVMILHIVLLPLGLYLFDMVTDLILAGQYYNSGDLTWFGLTLGFVLGPSIVINFVSLYISWDDDDSTPIKGRKCLLAVLQFSVVSGYLNILYLLVRGEDVEEHVEEDLPNIHLLEAMLESVPQLCLQLYILLLTGEQVSVLKVITMLASLLAAVKAVCLSYQNIKEEDSMCSCGFVTRLILLFVWKVVELSVRVLAIGLFASAFKPWIALPIGVQWLVMTVSLICIDEDFRDCSGVILAPLLMAVDTFSMTVSMDYKQTFWLNTVLTLLGNITMVTVWYTLKAGQYWYDVPALVGVVVGSFVSAGLGFIQMVFIIRDRDRKSQLDFETLIAHLSMINKQDSSAPDSGTYMEFETNV